MLIVHSLTKEFWDTYKDKDFYGEYSLNEFGFIHCSDIDTYHLVAPNFKNETKEMILILIDTEKLNAKIVWEDLKNCGVKFPHIYGLLNKDSIVQILPHLWNDKKEWIINDELKSLLNQK